LTSGRQGIRHCPAGKYLFRVKGKPDGNNWVSASNRIQVTIIPPRWQQWWFVGGILAIVTAFIYWFISSRNKKIEEQREEIETRQAINYFATSLQVQQTVDNILWDVARNCIGRLHFEDCVVYLMDEDKNVLIQKAAYGPKSPKEFEISSPLGIELGKGIVGSVALSQKLKSFPTRQRIRDILLMTKDVILKFLFPLYPEVKSGSN
jgi:hypothetical protein